jgi:uncharacterized protein (DUF302 family)
MKRWTKRLALNKRASFLLKKVNISRNHGTVTVPSPYTVDESLDRIEASARSKGMILFLRLDQRREAE